MLSLLPLLVTETLRGEHGIEVEYKDKYSLKEKEIISSFSSLDLLKAMHSRVPYFFWVCSFLFFF